MIKTHITPFACLLMAATSQGSIIVLDLPDAGTYSTPTTVISSGSFNGATFDISHTVGSTATDGSSVFSDGNQLGVQSASDLSTTTTGHYSTLEGNDNEGLSFTNLSVSNFAANGSGLDISDIEEELRFVGITLTAVGNNQDGANLSFTGFGTNTANFDLNPVSTTEAIRVRLSCNHLTVSELKQNKSRIQP